MSKGIYSSKTVFGLPNALILLMVIFFFVPFALRGARLALQKTENNAKDWLPADLRETEELSWFAKHFESDQFVTATWQGCTEDSQRLQLFLAKLENEVAKPPVDAESKTDLELARETLRDYVLFLDREEYFNWGGLNEKWLIDENQNHYYITPNGRLYRWDGGANVVSALSQTVSRAAGSFRLDGRFVAAFGSSSPEKEPNKFWADPRLLTTPLFKSIETRPQASAQTDPRLGGNEEGLSDFFDEIVVAQTARPTNVILTLTDAARRNLGHVVGRGVLGQPTGRLFEIAEECGVSAPPKPLIVPPQFSWLVQKSKIVEPALSLEGPCVDKVAFNEECSITLVRLIAFSLTLAISLSYVFLRSLRLTFQVLFVGSVSAIFSISMVGWSGAAGDATLLILPFLVFVVGVSGAVHFVNYYRNAVVEKGNRNAPEHAVSQAFLPCLFAAVITAIGYLSLYNSSILPLRNLALYATIGVMATLVLLYIFLPSSLTLFPPGLSFVSEKSTKAVSGRSVIWINIGAFIIRRHWYVNAALVGTMIFMGSGVLKLQTNEQLLKFFDNDSQNTSEQAWLESNFGQLAPVELVVRFPEEMQATVGEPAHSAEQRQLAKSKLTLRERAEAVRKIEDVLQDHFGYGEKSSCVAIEQSSEGKNNELWRVSLRVDATNNSDYGTLIQSLRSAVEPIVAAYRCRSEVMNAVASKDAQHVQGLVLVLGCSEPLSMRAGVQLAEETDNRDLALFAETLRIGLSNNAISKIQWHNPEQMPLSDGRSTSNEWANYLGKFDCVIMLKSHSDYDVPFVQQHATSYVDASEMLSEIRVGRGTYPDQMDVVYTGTIPVVYNAQRTLLERLNGSVASSFVLIGLLLACTLSPARTFLSALAPHNLLQALSCGFIAMLPNIFPLVIVFGLKGHNGSLLDISTMLTASVAMGITVHGTIHYLTWFRMNLREGMDRRHAILEAHRNVAPAMIQTTILGGLGLCVFALSTSTSLRMLGVLLATHISVSLMINLIFLPAMLSSPVGRLFTLRKAHGSPESMARQSSETAESIHAETDDLEYRLLDDPAPDEAVSPRNAVKPVIEEVSGGNAIVPPPKFLSGNRNHVRKR